MQRVQTAGSFFGEAAKAPATAAVIPLWLQIVMLVAVPTLSYIAARQGTRAGRTTAVELDQRARREELMRTVRWAAEKAIDDRDKTSQLGIAALTSLETSPLLQQEDQGFIDAISLAVLADAVGVVEEVEAEIEETAAEYTDGEEDHG